MISPKNHFISRYPDGVLLQADYQQLEICVQAQLSGDQAYIQDVLDGVDFHCIEKNTDVLTDKGWVKADNIKRYHKVASYSGTSICYSLPLDLFKQDNRKLLHVSGDLSDELISDNHNLYLDRKLQCVDKVEHKLKQTRFTYAAQYNWRPEASKYTDNQVRLLIWALTDSHVFKRTGTEKVNGIRWKLSKPRKIEALKNLLIEMNIPFKVNNCPKTGLNKLQPEFIIVYGEWQNWIFNQIGFKKTYPLDLLDVSTTQARIIYDTLSITDGNIKDKHLQMITTNLEGADLLQRIFILNGIACKLSYKQYKTAFKGKQNVRLYAYPEVHDRRYVTITEAGLGKVIGITTPTGTLVTRRNGKVQITGNCKRLALKEHLPYEEVFHRCKVEEDPEWVAKRSSVKAFSFARAYGAGVPKLSKGSGLSEDEIRDLIRAEEQAYPILTLWLAWLKEQVEKNGEYSDPFGGLYRFKKYPCQFEWQLKKGIKESYSPTEIKNYIVQGFATGKIVLMMLGRFYREYLKYKTNNEGIERFCLINTIHDSIMMDCRPEYVELAKILLQKELTDIEGLSKMFGYEWKVPLKIDMKTGSRWSDL